MQIHRHPLAIALVVSTAATLASAQSPNTDSAPLGPQHFPPNSMMLPAPTVRAPLDVESASIDDRCLGVQYAWGYFWVTGCGPSSQGNWRRIHQFDLNGSYVQSFAQASASPSWGGRDLACDPQSHRLWAGAEAGELVEYEFFPNAGPNGQLLYVTTYNLGIPETVRALAREPNTGRFITADFGGPIYEFDLNVGVLATHPNPGLAIFGAAYDFVDGTFWVWSQDQTASPTNRSLASELNSTSLSMTGRWFHGLDLTPGIDQAAGGADIYPDPNNPGALTFAALQQGEHDSIVSYDMRVLAPPPVAYCTGKTNSLGCVPSIATSQPTIAPGAGGNDYHVLVNNVISNRFGLVFYGVNGPFNAPFQGGTMCVSPPLKRTPLQNSGGGILPSCNGVLDVVINDPLGVDFAPGTVVRFQGWFRDPQDPSTTGLSNAIAVTTDAAAADTDLAKWKFGANGSKKPIVALSANATYRIHNDGPSTIRVRRFDSSGKIVDPPGDVTILAGDEVDMGMQYGESLEIIDDDQGSEGANGTYKKV